VDHRDRAAWTGGQPAPELARRAGFTVPPDTKVLLAELPTNLGELAVPRPTTCPPSTPSPDGGWRTAHRRS